MVETLLTNEMIEAGAALIRKMDKRGIRPDAAFWLYSTEQQTWKLVIAEFKVGIKGPKEFYRRIQEILATSPEPEIVDNVSLDDVTLVKPDEPIVALLRKAIRTSPDITGIRFKNNVINGTLIDDAYIYRIT